VQKLKEELEKEKERAALQKKIGSMIKKEVRMLLDCLCAVVWCVGAFIYGQHVHV